MPQPTPSATDVLTAFDQGIARLERVLAVMKQARSLIQGNEALFNDVAEAEELATRAVIRRAKRQVAPRPRTRRTVARRVDELVREPRAKRRPKATVDLGPQVLEVVRRARKPLKAREVCAAIPTAADHDLVVRTLRDLVARGMLVKTGATIGLRYAVPGLETAEA